MYVVVYVGCIECGVPTELVGVYATLEAAQAAERTTKDGGDSWARHGGQGYVAVFGPVAVGETKDPSSDDLWEQVDG